VKTFSFDSIVESAAEYKILLSEPLRTLADELDDARRRARDFQAFLSALSSRP